MPALKKSIVQKSGIGHLFPGFKIALGYKRSWLRGDLTAGFVLAALLVPQGMAYAQLAGLPPVTGLYTTVLGLVAYALVGPSRILVLGPDSALGPLIAATILPLAGANGDPVRAVALAGLLSVMMGGVCLLAGLAKLGTVAELLGKPVRIGYLNGIGVVVLVSQLPKLFGFSSEGDTTIAEATNFFRNLSDGATNGTALAIGGLSLALILVFRRVRPRVPAVLIAVVAATIAVAWLGLGERGLPLVGSVPAGFPAPSIPTFSLGDVGAMFLASIGLAFVTLADTTALSRAFSAEAGEYVDPNREIAALGVANIAVGLFQGFPLSASSSRTAVAKTAGANTQLVGVLGAIVIVLLLVFANGLTANLPTAVLAAVVIAAAFTLFDLPSVRWLYKVRRSEFWLSVSAVVGVVAVGVLEGIVIAIVLSLAVFVHRAWRPHDATLGRLSDRKGYHDLARHPEAEHVPGLALYRFDAPLFFANAEHFVEQINELIYESRPESLKWVIVAAEPITDIDTTGAEQLANLLTQMEERGVTLAFAELKGPVKDRLRRYQLAERIGEERLYPTLETAVEAYLEETGNDWDDPYGE